MRLLGVAPAAAEISVTEKNGAKLLYEIAKGNLTPQRPDVGAQGKVSF